MVNVFLLNVHYSSGRSKSEKWRNSTFYRVFQQLTGVFLIVSLLKWYSHMTLFLFIFIFISSFIDIYWLPSPNYDAALDFFLLNECNQTNMRFVPIFFLSVMTTFWYTRILSTFAWNIIFATTTGKKFCYVSSISCLCENRISFISIHALNKI